MNESLAWLIETSSEMSNDEVFNFISKFLRGHWATLDEKYITEPHNEDRISWASEDNSTLVELFVDDYRNLDPSTIYTKEFPYRILITYHNEIVLYFGKSPIG